MRYAISIFFFGLAIICHCALPNKYGKKEAPWYCNAIGTKQIEHGSGTTRAL